MIFQQTSANYSDWIYERLGKGAEHARLIYQEWYRTGKITGMSPHFANAKTLLNSILQMTDLTFPLTSVGLVKDQATEKYIFRTYDGYEIETVLIPMRGRMTLCLSSQVGCRMGCRFCETARMGLKRHLSVQEIVAQIFFVKNVLGINVRNLVFMGMGEPLDNFEALMQTIAILVDQNGFAFGPSRITISTSGAVEPIYRLIERGDSALNLAVSINAPNDEIRNRLMPVNRKNDMESLKKAMLAYCRNPRRKIFIEYVLIEDINDSIENAHELANYLQGVPVTVNLIPYNPQRKTHFRQPELLNIELFASHLRSYNLKVFIRAAKGQSIMAACGQLGNRKLDLQRVCC